MGKKKQTREAPDDAAAKAPFHDAFAGLGALRDALPEGEPAASEATEARTTMEPTAPGGGDPDLRGDLVVRHERKGRGGKTVTLLLGLRSPPEAQRSLARELGRALGCAARTEGEQLVLAGDQRTRLHQWLVARGARVRLG